MYCLFFLINLAISGLVGTTLRLRSSIFLKTSTIILVVILFIITLILVAFQSLVSIIAIPTGIFFIYYLIVLFLISILNKQNPKQALLIIIWVLFLVPLLWCLINPESLFDFVTPNLHLDMK